MNKSGFSSARVFTFLLLLLCAACSKSPPAVPPAPVTTSTLAPTAFYDWCVAETFGLTSPQRELISAGIKGIPTSVVGSAELKAWTPAHTEAEARERLVSTWQDLRRTAIAKGVTLEDDEAPTNASGQAFKAQYRVGNIRGTLKARFDLLDNEEGGKKVKSYFLMMSIDETAAE